MVISSLMVLLGLCLVFSIFTYNRLIAMRNDNKNAMANIQVQLKRRHDLIPNIVSTAKAYLSHEKNVLLEVTKARQQALDVQGVREQAQAENFLTQALRQLFAVVENYPNLKADKNMLELHDELISTENKIAFSRDHYNDSVTNFNTMREQFPMNIVANLFGFRMDELFILNQSQESECPKISF